MIVLKILGIALIVLAAFFVLTFIIYFFNLDMKLMAALIKPLTKYYDWSKARRDAKKMKDADKSKQSGGKQAEEKTTQTQTEGKSHE